MNHQINNFQERILRQLATLAGASFFYISKDEISLLETVLAYAKEFFSKKVSFAVR
ncbi:hypothetical protein ACFDTO_30770 [Microbacteriaceae bacterium 4G12]